jgi:4-amino-4-deoxy-L-arabinose transferase-like glycosyltransferase
MPIVKYPIPILLLLCLLLYLPGITRMPPVDRDEARFAQASRQMLEDNDFVRIRFQDEPRHKKPVGIYWLQAGCAKIFGALGTDRIWPYRIPSVLGAILAVLATFLFGRRLFGKEIAFLGAVLMASSLLLVVEAHLSKTDAMMLAAITTAQGSLAVVYTRHGSGQKIPPWLFLLFWAAQGWGVLLKGPIVPLVSALTVLVLVIADRKAAWLKKLRPILGILMVVLMASPWVLSIQRATGGAFFADAVKSDLLPKLFSGQESHGAPPGYYILLMMVTFWPGSFFAWPALRNAWRERTAAPIRFCLAWIIPNWLMFELIPTKLPHYVLPVYPALALLTALAVVSVSENSQEMANSKLAKTGYWGWFLVTALLGTAITAFPLALEGRFDPLALIPILTVILLLILFFERISSHQIREIVMLVAVATVLILGPTLQWIFPAVNGLWISREAAARVARAENVASCMAVDVVAVGYSEPSLVFHCGTPTHLVPATEAARLLNEDPDRIVLVEQEDEPDFIEATKQLNRPVRLDEEFRGFNYSKSRWLTLKLYRAQSDKSGG